MKKILTLLLSLGSLASVNAQSGNNAYDHQNRQAGNAVADQKRNDLPAYASQEAKTPLYGRNDNSKDYAYNDYHANGSRYSSPAGNDRVFLVQKVNNNYDFKIRTVMNDPYLRYNEKKWQVRNLENQRADKLHEINTRFYKRADDRSYNDNWHH